jgi:hypothetical protein
MKSMITSMIAVAALMIGFQAHAGLTQVQTKALTQVLTQPALFDDMFTVGDSADYKLSGAGGLLNGTVHMFVRELVAQGWWVEQDIKLGMMGDQKAEALYDKETGKVLKMIVNGQEQAVPDQSKMKVIQTKREKLTVPKGEFDCMYLKIHDEGQNQDVEMWVNPTIPVARMVKQIAQSQLGPMSLELTDFVKK